jgi:hypothetical protein
MRSVAPFHSCLACYRGDTTTGLILRGQAEWVIAFLHLNLGIPMRTAGGIVEQFAEDTLGCPPGTVPDGIAYDMPIRVCEACAGLETAGLRGDVAAGGDWFPIYVQRPAAGTGPA